jgi:hypothetical protein
MSPPLGDAAGRTIIAAQSAKIDRRTAAVVPKAGVPLTAHIREPNDLASVIDAKSAARTKVHQSIILVGQTGLCADPDHRSNH